MPYAHVREITIDRDGELRIQNLPLRVGDRVQVVVIPRNGEKSGAAYPLHGATVRYDRPFEPASDPNDWEANQ